MTDLEAVNLKLWLVKLTEIKAKKVMTWEYHTKDQQNFTKTLQVLRSST